VNEHFWLLWSIFLGGFLGGTILWLVISLVKGGR
jgi:hypothetical protein